MIIDIFILELCQRILCCTTFYKIKQLTESFSSLLCHFCIIIIGFATLNSTQLSTILHQWTCSPEICLTKITQSHNLIDTKLILVFCSCTYRGFIPIDRQEVCSLTKILCSFQRTFFIRKTWQIKLCFVIHIFVYIWKSTKILH